MLYNHDEVVLYSGKSQILRNNAGKDVFKMNDMNQLIITKLFRGDRENSDEQLSASEMKATVKSICETLRSNGFDPVRQLAGYIISEDPAYIPDCKNARVEISKLDRDFLLSELVKEYISDPSEVSFKTDHDNGQNT